MAKSKNLIETVTLTLSTTPHVFERLERLVHTGYYGKNAAEAAERLLARTIEELEETARLPPVPREDTRGEG